MKRTNYCGTLSEAEIGKSVTVMGWAQTKRDMGGIIFIDLRDREGILQVVFDAKNLSTEQFKIVEQIRNEYVVAVTGVLRIRGEETYNPKLKTGTVELVANEIELLSEADTLPFSLEDGSNVRENLRLKYRFLDIRRPEMINNLRYRHKIVRAVHEYLSNEGFIEVETPILTKSTPEGARDYLVPSRVHQGTFYALPQSPQIFKQLLMVGGVDKYYQVARCFRDEDLRADRQPEFTQVDMEMSFIEQEDILVHLEKMFKYLFKVAKDIDIKEAFPRLTWQECMDKYGSDKPDIRFDLPITDLTDLLKDCNFSVFKNVLKSGGSVRAIKVDGGADFTRGTIENLTQKAIEYGAKGMAWISLRENGEIYSILTKYFDEKGMQEIIDAVGAKPGDFILFCADKLNVVYKTLGGLRLDLADMLNLRKPDDYKFLFVTDFPQFEYSEEEERWVAMHHPFTMPYPEDVQYLKTEPGKVRAQAYDVVLNGIELGSGSIRIHRQDLQTKMFEGLGFTNDEIEERFGFMVNAFKYGTPPHGGFAFGLDRLVMQFIEADSLRDVIAFPKTKDASCLMTQAPNVVDKEQLEVLNIGQFAAEREDGKKSSKKAVKTEIDVDNVANLARLNLKKDEKEQMSNDMKDIIAFANKLSEIDTTDIPITTYVIPMKNVFREDVSNSYIERDELLNNAPTKSDGYVTVPRVVE